MYCKMHMRLSTFTTLALGQSTSAADAGRQAACKQAGSFFTSKTVRLCCNCKTNASGTSLGLREPLFAARSTSGPRTTWHTCTLNLRCENEYVRANNSGNETWPCCRDAAGFFGSAGVAFGFAATGPRGRPVAGATGPRRRRSGRIASLKSFVKFVESESTKFCVESGPPLSQSPIRT